MIFTYPYPFTYDPPAIQSGGPTVINRGNNATGLRSFYLQSNSSRPSSALMLTSFGMDAGVPRDGRNRRFTTDSELVIEPTISYSTFFYSGGVFASALTSATVKIYVEETDRRGNFIRGIEGSEYEILREDPWWFSGGRSWNPSGREITVVTNIAPIDRRIIVHWGYSYRVFIDVYGEIRAAGYGGLGGSGAIAQVSLTLNQVDMLFIPL